MTFPNIQTPAGNIWWCADHHFGHGGVIRMCNRPFASAEEMNRMLVEAWNAVVRPGDTVYHLGDFAMGLSPEQCAQVFASLNGRKHLCVGNHDKPRVTTLPWETVSERVTVVTGGHRLVLDHYPLRAWAGVFRGALHLHGHTHGSLPGTSQSCDVGVDVWGYRPVGLPDILERMAATPNRPEEIERAVAREDADAR